jgi:hypothetical protein
MAQDIRDAMGEPAAFLNEKGHWAYTDKAVIAALVVSVKQLAEKLSRLYPELTEDVL